MKGQEENYRILCSRQELGGTYVYTLRHSLAKKCAIPVHFPLFPPSFSFSRRLTLFLTFFFASLFCDWSLWQRPCVDLKTARRPYAFWSWALTVSFTSWPFLRSLFQNYSSSFLPWIPFTALYLAWVVSVHTVTNVFSSLTSLLHWNTRSCLSLYFCTEAFSSLSRTSRYVCLHSCNWYSTDCFLKYLVSFMTSSLKENLINDYLHDPFLSIPNK